MTFKLEQISEAEARKLPLKKYLEALKYGVGETIKEIRLLQTQIRVSPNDHVRINNLWGFTKAYEVWRSLLSGPGPLEKKIKMARAFSAKIADLLKDLDEIRE